MIVYHAIEHYSLIPNTFNYTNAATTHTAQVHLFHLKRRSVVSTHIQKKTMKNSGMIVLVIMAKHVQYTISQGILILFANKTGRIFIAVRQACRDATLCLNRVSQQTIMCTCCLRSLHSTIILLWQTIKLTISKTA